MPGKYSIPNLSDLSKISLKNEILSQGIEPPKPLWMHPCNLDWILGAHQRQNCTILHADTHVRSILMFFFLFREL